MFYWYIRFRFDLSLLSCCAISTNFYSSIYCSFKATGSERKKIYTEKRNYDIKSSNKHTKCIQIYIKIHRNKYRHTHTHRNSWAGILWTILVDFFLLSKWKKKQFYGPFSFNPYRYILNDWLTNWQVGRLHFIDF